MNITTLWVLSLVTLSPALGDEILLKNATLLDPVKQTALKTNILIRDGRISEISDSIPKPFSGKTLDLTGKWILPGFTDAHVHSSWGNPSPTGHHQLLTIEEVSKLSLYAGVTSFLDLFADEDMIFRARKKSRAKGYLGADIYAAGPMLTCTRGHGSEFGIPTRMMDTPEEAEKVIRALAKKKPDVIKIAYDHARAYLSMDKSTMEAAIRMANKLHIKTVVHIGTWQDASEAVQAGATAITHLYESDIPDDLVKQMKAKGVWEIPTMTYQSELMHIVENSKLLNSGLLRALASTDLLHSYQQLDLRQPFLNQILKLQRASKETYLHSLKKLSDSGIQLLTGTDAGDIGVFQGYSVHREMQIFNDAGIPAWKVLAAATTSAKKFLGKPSGIQVGDIADLVVLSHSPLVQISHTEDVETIIHRGEIIDRQSLLPTRRLSTRLPN